MKGTEAGRRRAEPRAWADTMRARSAGGRTSSASRFVRAHAQCYEGLWREYSRTVRRGRVLRKRRRRVRGPTPHLPQDSPHIGAGTLAGLPVHTRAAAHVGARTHAARRPRARRGLARAVKAGAGCAAYSAAALQNGEVHHYSLFQLHAKFKKVTARSIPRTARPAQLARSPAPAPAGNSMDGSAPVRQPAPLGTAVGSPRPRRRRCAALPPCAISHPPTHAAQRLRCRDTYIVRRGMRAAGGGPAPPGRAGGHVCTAGVGRPRNDRRKRASDCVRAEKRSPRGSHRCPARRRAPSAAPALGLPIWGICLSRATSVPLSCCRGSRAAPVPPRALANR